MKVRKKSYTLWLSKEEKKKLLENYNKYVMKNGIYTKKGKNSLQSFMLKKILS